MDEDLVEVYQFEMSIEELTEYYQSKYGPNTYFFALDAEPECEFPINEILKDEGIQSFNKYELADAKSIIEPSINERRLLFRVFVHKKDEVTAKDIIKNQIKFESTDELDNFVPFDEPDDSEPLNE